MVQERLSSTHYIKNGQDTILFPLKESHLNTGLRSVPVGLCPTSFVDPQIGLHYSSRAIEECSSWNLSEVIYLLYSGHRPSEEELLSWLSQIDSQEECPAEIIETLSQIPALQSPMKLFSIALLLLGMHRSLQGYRKDFFHLLKNAPILCAHVMNAHASHRQPMAFSPSFDYVNSFLDNLGAFSFDRKLWQQFLPLFINLHLDHGGGNLSTFVGKAVASGLEDLYGSLAAAMSALEGPRHGQANQKALELVREVHSRFGEALSREQLSQWLEERLERKELIYGFGHAVLRREDPRATILYKFLEQHFPQHALFTVARKMREMIPTLLMEKKKISNPYPNVDAVSGLSLFLLGCRRLNYFPLFFGMARLIGISIQIIYERCEANSGKGTPIVRPKYLFCPRE